MILEEERFSGIKHDNSFPKKSIEWILKTENIKTTDIDTVCYYENPYTKKSRIINVVKRTFLRIQYLIQKLYSKHILLVVT